MSATNYTTNLNLSQFGNTDMPAWRQDYNGDMLKIDNAYTADISGATAETSADPSDYMKFYDVSATTNKKILISDLLKGAKVEDLTDTDITTPTDDDGLVYDATAQKWKNKQITTKEQWKKNGAYNLLPNMWTTQAKNGLTYTKRSDGTIAVDNGSPSATTYVNIVPQSSPIKFPVGKYKMVGFADTGVTGFKNFYVVNITTNTVYQYGSNNGIFEVTDASHEWYCSYAFDTGADPTVFSSAILYPMITTDLNATYADYVPYAKTNRELTEIVRGAVIQHAVTITPNTNEKWSSILARVKTAIDSYIASLGISGIRFRTIEIVGDGRYFLPLNQVFDTSFYNGIYTSTRIDGTYFAECDIMLNANGGTYKWFLVSSAGVTTMTDKSNDNAGTIIVYLELLSPNIIQNN